jgi:hypothetical protein
MDSRNRRSPGYFLLAAGVGLAVWAGVGVGTAQKPAPGAAADYAAVARPLVQKYCLGCHSTKLKKGGLDLERFATPDEVRKDLKPWQGVVEMLEAGEMPPADRPQPTAGERRELAGWARGFLDAEARVRAGDPGHVPLRRLSNAEYDRTVHDLTGVDLRPTREFPADGAAGEGFTNAAEALTDISPALLAKYLNAAKAVADHAVLLPDGFRFSPTTTRRDWTDENLARLRGFYAEYTADGRLPLRPYLAATVRHRDALAAGRTTPEEVAAKERLNAKYLGVLWRALTDATPSEPLDHIRARWRTATEADVAALAAEVAAWQGVLWKVVPVGSYRDGNTTRQVANDPAAADAQPLRLAVKPAPGQGEVVLYLVARELSPGGGHVVWHRPRFEGPGQPPLLLRDYPRFGPAYEVDYPTAFADTPKYLAAVAEVAQGSKSSVEAIANRYGLDVAFLKRWIDVLAVEPRGARGDAIAGWTVPAVPLKPLEEPAPKNPQRPAVNGWRRKGTDLPTVISNASDKTEQVPGRLSPHAVAVHPMPKEFVAVVWTSPVKGAVSIGGMVAHAHPACGNGVTWWLEHRRADRADVMESGALNLGQSALLSATQMVIGAGDQLVLAVDARNGDHSCDLTEISLTISEVGQPGRSWDLARDVADSILAGNPHADRHGNAAVWAFVEGPSRPAGKAAGPVIPPDSVLGRWREAAADPRHQAAAADLAGRARALLTGPRPAAEKGPDRALYDSLVSVDSPLFRGLDATRFGKPRSGGPGYGLEPGRFGKPPAEEASLVVAPNSVTEVRLPAALFRGREFVVEGGFGPVAGDRVGQFQVLTAPPGSGTRWDGKAPVVAAPAGAAYRRLIQGHEEFRRCFPLFTCFPRVIPDDETVCLKMYHREDEPLGRLFLDIVQQRRLDRLWAEHRFISRQPVAENDYLPQFIGFVTQDQPKELLAYFEGQRGAFRQRAEEFERDEAAAVPKQLEALLDFAARAYRRPLSETERAGLLALYHTLRGKGVAHEEAFRGVLARVLVAPAFLFRVEQAPPGKAAGPVSDWELATRLSYFLWSSAPDDELRRLAAAGRLREPNVLADQARRMLRDDRVRALAVEFGTQWIHVRGFDELREKNEKLFPTFDAGLRRAIDEESVLFFQDLFQADRPVAQVLDSDATFLNEALAKHYGIPGVTGPQWRRVEGVRRYGRGGILGLASVQTKQSGASRTSPVLRGNWVVETLLGEKLPRPPANVPRLPEEEGGDGLTVRQQVEKHAKAAECAVCHRRVDPFGFALERYDPIGRLREKDLGGLAVDSHARLKDGTEFDGIDGLRTYLLTTKKDVFVRLFCRRLLGYALGRAVTLSDQALIDEMVAELDRNGGRLSAAVLAVVKSPQFRMVRGSEFAE